ncbi:unnamed protein product [Cuscuta campestris]|uniref:NPH3 domain-containing protein n=1 Tax=Cuscuta campestris TaxID=132261 RepID=A0A484KY12_9ASTE|nr:unnamed protein product [Cuscuta campestris]
MKFMKLGSKPDCFHSAGNNVRYIASDLASDIIIFVGEVKFYLHKFPLLSKSSLLQKLIAKSVEGNGEVHLDEIPGGPAAFEICAKFCYSVAVTLNAHNVIAARCAAEYLGMHENVDKGNLVYKIDVFLSTSIFRSWKDSIIALQTMKSPQLPLCEELKLFSHCVDSIASKASADVSRVDWSYTYNRNKASDEIGLRNRVVPKDWWVEDLSELDVDLYKQVIVTIKKKGIVPNAVIGEALKTYASRRLQGYHEKGAEFDASKYQSVLDTILTLLPPEKGSVSTSFLLKLLKAYISLGSGETSQKELIKRIGLQLEEASINDLLIRTSDMEPKTMYNVDVVQTILREFMTSNQEEPRTEPEARDEIQEVRKKPSGVLTEASKLMVAKLVDGYLAEIAKDPNLSCSTFIGLAEMVASFPRPAHDGLYRAIDMYLKEHPGMSKSERKRICRLMDCKKLSPDACMHAIQNDRLPLRVVVQILFFEQVKSAAAANNASSSSGSTTPDLPAAAAKPAGNSVSYGSSRSFTTTEEEWDAEEVRALRSELAALKLGNAADKAAAATIGKMKGLVVPKRVFARIWSGKGGHGSGDNSGSDSSGSSLGCNAAAEDAKSSSTPSRKSKRSVS